MSGRASDNINIGTADVYFEPIDSATSDYCGTEYYLGLTQDGANIKYEIKWHELKSDQYGDNLMDSVMIGEDFSCDVNLLETTKERIALVIGTAKAVGNSNNPNAVTFGRRIGLRASQVCGRLRFHPVSMGQLDGTMDVIVYLAFNEAGVNLAFKKDSEWIIPCKWRALIDDRREDGDRLFRIGEGSAKESNGINETGKMPIEFTIAPLNQSTTIGSPINFSANAVFDDYSTGDVTPQTSWNSTNSSIATISVIGNNAVVVPVGVGTTIITGSYLGYSVNTTVTVSGS